MPPEDSPVVITGLGAVCAFGWGTRALHRGLRGNATAIGPFDRFDPAGHRTELAGQVRWEGAPSSAKGTGGDRRRSVADRFALACAREAIRHADLDLQNPDAGVVGVYLGTSTGGMFEAEAYFDEMTRWRGARSRVSRLASFQNSGPADAVARAIASTGPVETVSSACASSAMAIGSALDAVRSGTVDVALAGGADSLCELTYAGFNSLRAVDADPCRPFRADRAGLSLGEGGGVLVIESSERAMARRARPLAELSGYGASCDAYHMTAPDPDGCGAARAIRAALADAGIDAAAVDFVNAHGTGTPHNDASEWSALSLVFGDRARELPVTSTKGFVGHLLGSSGALEAVATVLGVHHREVHPTPGPGGPDPALPMTLILDTARGLPGSPTALSTSLGFGGANAALVFRRAPVPLDEVVL